MNRIFFFPLASVECLVHAVLRTRSIAVEIKAWAAAVRPGQFWAYSTKICGFSFERCPMYNGLYENGHFLRCPFGRRRKSY